MGLIVNLPNGKKNYINTNGNTASITKELMSISQTIEDENANVITNTRIYAYCIRCDFNVWDNEELYLTNGGEFGQKPISTNSIELRVDTIPDNIYVSCYNKIKETLYSYEDDI